MVPEATDYVLRITATSTNGMTTLAVEGRLTGEWVDELSRAVADARRLSHPLTLDLSQVTFVDTIGAVLLRTVADSGVALEKPSDFVSGLIRGGQA